MANCPRCSVSVPAYTRCDRCGLMLGFDGLTVLIDHEDTPQFQRVRALARRQPSYSEWVEENGYRFLRVTYAADEMPDFRDLARAASTLRRKRAFVNGLEVPWHSIGGAVWEPAAVRPRKHSALREVRLSAN